MAGIPNRARSPGTDGFTSPPKDAVKHLLTFWGRDEWTRGQWGDTKVWRKNTLTLVGLELGSEGPRLNQEATSAPTYRCITWFSRPSNDPWRAYNFMWCIADSEPRNRHPTSCRLCGETCVFTNKLVLGVWVHGKAMTNILKLIYLRSTSLDLTALLQVWITSFYFRHWWKPTSSSTNAGLKLVLLSVMEHHRIYGNGKLMSIKIKTIHCLPI